MTERTTIADSFARFSDEAAVPGMRTENVRPGLDFLSVVACNWSGGGTMRVLFCFVSERRKEKEGKEKRRGSLLVAFAPGEEYGNADWLWLCMGRSLWVEDWVWTEGAEA